MKQKSSIVHKQPFGIGQGRKFSEQSSRRCVLDKGLTNSAVLKAATIYERYN